MREGIRCGNCGTKGMKYKDAIGRGFPYKQYQKVILTVSCDLLTCEKCGEIGTTMDDCKRIDDAIERTLSDVTNHSTEGKLWILKDELTGRGFDLLAEVLIDGFLGKLQREFPLLPHDIAYVNDLWDIRKVKRKTNDTGTL